MLDTENLVRLINRADPVVLKGVLKDSHGHILPQIIEKEPKRSVRAKYLESLRFLSKKERYKLDDWAERINFLTGPQGADILDALRDKLNKDQLASYEFVGNQYDRSLWLFKNAPLIFMEAIDIKLADDFRQSMRCYSGFVGPIGLQVETDSLSSSAFHEAVAHLLKCQNEQVAVDVFRRPQIEDDVGEETSAYQVSIHHNKAPESIDFVKDSKLENALVTSAASTFVTYDPVTGNIDVLSKKNENRETVALLFAEHLLRSPIQCEKIPIKFYDYQFLSAPVHLDCMDGNVDWVKVTQLGYSNHGRVMDFKISKYDEKDIHEAARADVQNQYRFAEHYLTFATISIGVRKEKGERARVIHIHLRGDNRCNIKTKREKDRILCERLLVSWGIFKEVSYERIATASNA